MTDAIKPQKIYVILGKHRPHAVSLEPFEGACEYVLSPTPESLDTLDVSDVCRLMGASGKRKEIIEFSNFCVKQVEEDSVEDTAAYTAVNCAAKATSWAGKAADWVDATSYADVKAAHYAAKAADWAATWAAKATSHSDVTAVREEQKKFLMELLTIEEENT